eukprot:GFKZ01014039.1.p1 GENE.GFKZ01014039.1~~GFKZ01014039.1.p1  ORF type:complete len:142 (-),score=14.87 GFKZ01014039.1:390-815(-)
MDRAMALWKPADRSSVATRIVEFGVRIHREHLAFVIAFAMNHEFEAGGFQLANWRRATKSRVSSNAWDKKIAMTSRCRAVAAPIEQILSGRGRMGRSISKEVRLIVAEGRSPLAICRTKAVGTEIPESPASGEPPDVGQEL